MPNLLRKGDDSEIYYEETMDIYGMGVVLNYMLKHTGAYIADNPEFLQEMKDLLFKMIHPNCFERINLVNLVQEYKIALNKLTPNIESDKIIEMNVRIEKIQKEMSEIREIRTTQMYSIEDNIQNLKEENREQVQKQRDKYIRTMAEIDRVMAEIGEKEKGIPMMLSRIGFLETPTSKGGKFLRARRSKKILRKKTKNRRNKRKSMKISRFPPFYYGKRVNYLR